MEDVNTELGIVQQELKVVKNKMAAKRQEWLKWENLMGPLTGPANKEVLQNFNQTMQEKERWSQSIAGCSPDGQSSGLGPKVRVTHPSPQVQSYIKQVFMERTSLVIVSFQTQRYDNVLNFSANFYSGFSARMLCKLGL